MRKAFAVALAVLAIFAFIGCSQNNTPLVIIGNNNHSSDSTPIEVRSFIEALDSQLPSDIETVMNGTSVPGLERVMESTISSSSLRTFSRTGEDSYSVVFRFTESGYAVSGYGVIVGGTFSIDFTGSTSTSESESVFTSVSQTMKFEGLKVSKTGSIATETVTIENLEQEAVVTIRTDTSTGAVNSTGISSSMNLIQSITINTGITVDNRDIPVEDVAEAETIDTPFGGGFGTESFPYVIRTADQFKEIQDHSEDMLNGDYLYFDIVEDLDFTGVNDIGILKFRGDLDFNGNTVSGISTDQLSKSFYTIIDDIIEGNISNLEYRPNDMLPLAYTCGWTSGVQSVRDEWITKFENVNVYGDFRDISNNTSLYILQAFNGSLEFRDCISDVFATGDSYDGVFLGGYPQETTERLAFYNCVNKGTLITRNAGLLTGNSTYTPEQVIVEGMVNEGRVIGTESSGAYCGLNIEKDEIAKLNNEISAKITGTGEISVRKSNLAVDYNDDKTVATITDVGNEAASYRISGLIYTRMMTPAYDDKGTLLVSFDMEGEFGGAPAQASFPVLQVVDYKYAADKGGVADKDEYSNDIVKINDETYYLVTERHPYASDSSVTAVIVDSNHSHVPSNLTYNVFTYDSDGIPIGFNEIKVSE